MLWAFVIIVAFFRCVWKRVIVNRIFGTLLIWLTHILYVFVFFFLFLLFFRSFLFICGWKITSDNFVFLYASEWLRVYVVGFFNSRISVYILSINFNDIILCYYTILFLFCSFVMCSHCRRCCHRHHHRLRCRHLSLFPWEVSPFSLSFV